MLMLSMPPAIITALRRRRAMMSCASIAAFMPEPHTLLMVVQPVEGGNPAPSAAWRAGAWPMPGRKHVAHDRFLHVLGLRCPPARPRR